MNPQSFKQAKKYVLGRLEKELSPGLVYHSLEHTTRDVVPAAELIAAHEGIQGHDLNLLLTAAWFHDLGFIEQRVGHEAIGVRLATEVLPGFGYGEAEIEVIQGIIMATVIPQSPNTLSEQILCDADLDVLGREDFWSRNLKLRQEQAFFGREFTDVEWLTGQLHFIESHRYFTASARKLRDAGQVENVALIKRALHKIELEN